MLGSRPLQSIRHSSNPLKATRNSSNLLGRSSLQPTRSSNSLLPPTRRSSNPLQTIRNRSVIWPRSSPLSSIQHKKPTWMATKDWVTLITPIANVHPILRNKRFGSGLGMSCTLRHQEVVSHKQTVQPYGSGETTLRTVFCVRTCSTQCGHVTTKFPICTTPH